MGFVNEAVEKLLDACRSGSGSANLTIRGPGGIGKTAVAASILHHPDIKSHFGDRTFFVSCEAITTATSLAMAVLKAFGFELADGDSNITKTFLSSISDNMSPSIICLDNFETTWEDSSDKSTISTLLTHLATRQSLSVILTKRGTEIPLRQSLKWIMLRELGVLHEEAAMELFGAVAGYPTEHQEPQLRELIGMLDCVPLAIQLVSCYCADQSMPVSRVIPIWKSHWTKLEKAQMHMNKEDSLSISINLSLKARKIGKSSEVMHLFRVLCHHPSGISRYDLPKLVKMVLVLSLCIRTPVRLGYLLLLLAMNPSYD